MTPAIVKKGKRGAGAKKAGKSSLEKTSGKKLFGEFLFEIGCEEIPAGMIARALHELQELLSKHMVAAGLIADSSSNTSPESSIETFGAPRRLVAIARRVRLAFDNVGEPTRAAISFAEKQGVPLSQISIVNTPKGECLAVKQTVVGKPAAQVLEKILPQVIGEITWPRSMYWTGAKGSRFIRPIRWIVALLDGKVIPVSFAEVHSGNRSEGHRFLGKNAIPVASPADYESRLKKNFVLFRSEERRTKIETELRSITSRKNLRAHEDSGLL
ncbi:MAG: glycine--tRNA ligase subunit beta, partial [Candidatus Acidiferrales bacterium]